MNGSSTSPKEALSLVNKLIDEHQTEDLLAKANFYQTQCYYAVCQYHYALRSYELSRELLDNIQVEELAGKITLAIEIAPKLEQILSQLQHNSKIIFTH